MIGVVVETNQNNGDHHKVGPVYGGRDLGWYTRLDRGYIGVVICGVTCDRIDEAICVVIYRATCDSIDEVTGADIPWSIFDALH